MTLTPLHLAALNNAVQEKRNPFCNGENIKPRFTEAVRSLLEEGADIDNQENEYGFTPLHCAIFGGNIQIVNLLLQHKANPFLVDKKGLPPSLVARMFGKSILADLVEKQMQEFPWKMFEYYYEKEKNARGGDDDADDVSVH